MCNKDKTTEPLERVFIHSCLQQVKFIREASDDDEDGGSGESMHSRLAPHDRTNQGSYKMHQTIIADTHTQTRQL